MPTIEPNSIESESVRAETLHPWPAETCFHCVVIVMKTVVRTVDVIGTTTAKNPSSMPFLEAGVTFSSGLEALNRYYVGWLLRWLKRKPPARRGVFSLDEPPMSDFGRQYSTFATTFLLASSKTLTISSTRRLESSFSIPWQPVSPF